MKISFGLNWTNILKANIHWDQDFRRFSQTPSLIGIRKSAKFRATIEAAIQRARIRKPSGWEDDDNSNQKLGVRTGGHYSI